MPAPTDSASMPGTMPATGADLPVAAGPLGPGPVPDTVPPDYREPESRGAETAPRTTPSIKRTRVSGTWVAVIVAAIVLIFLLVFILQNLTTVTVQFLGFSGSLPLGVAMLFAAIAGAILVALIGTARILQLRRFARRVGTRGGSPR
jgi:uncharacterized integral membrane protein